MRIYGAKGGGGGGHTPIEAPETGRSKQIVNIVEVLSEGEISGLADGMKSVYLNNTPIQNQDGSYNFNNVSGELNVGLQDQNVLSGYDSSQNEVSVGVEVKKSTGAIVRTVTDARITRLRFNVGVKMLYSQNDQGDTNPTSVTLRISVGDQHYDYHIHGKYSSQYLEKFEVANLPPVPFNIRVERITADSEKQRLQNGTIWTSYTEIIDTDFTYPNTAVFGVSFDSDYFNGVPTRNYLLKGIKVKVPSNYNPETRAYNGLWDGTFKIAWTDNPAWVLYDIITNKRYGLGGLIGEFGCDKWTLYDIGRYCDALVDDGFGGKEPRFTCNAWITDIDDAYKVINNICSIFRAIPVWTGTEFSAIIDRPADPSWTYTNANVKDGKFERTYSAKKSRHNAVKVTYSDKNNGYQKAVEYVSDDESIAKNGLNLTEVTAFGCTSRGQAYRTGRWLIETEKLEKETITFTVGREGLMHLPGDIIRVNDNDYAGANVGGRVLAVNGNKITLDREITLSGNSFLTYINKSAKESTLRITAVNGTIATLASTPSDIEPYTVWALTTEQIKSGLYKAMTLTENDDGTFTVTALQHEPQKEAIVDKSAHFVPTNKTAYRAPQIQDVDTKVGYDGKLYVTADIGSGDGEVTFDVRIVKDGKLYEYRQGLSNPNLALENLPNGEYTVIIYAKNKAGQVMSEKASHFTINKPPAPTGVNVSGGLGAITIEWDWVDDVTYTEIFASEDEHFANASKIAKVLSRSHVHSVGAEQIRYYWLRHVRGVNNGPFYQEQGIKGESAVDLDKKLEKLNKELSKNIVNEVIDTALPARKLEMIKTVERLETPTENLGHHQIYNEEDGKLYVWDGNKYTAKVQAIDLEGQLASSQLDQTLIDQLNRADSTASSAAQEAGKVKNSLAQEITNRQNAIQAEITNRQNAIQAEATNRNNAIKVESANLTKKIQDEASARGTAINQLQNVDAQQAQQITTLTAKADNALSGITAEQKARADGDKANADKITALTSRVGSAEGTITSTSRTVATLDGKVQALHTIQAVAISGGKKAIAGISMGASGSESSVIVMADKFNVVKNAQDGTVKPMFGVVNNKVAVNGDLIADGAISARMMAANSVQAGAIQAGAIRTNHIATGEITADRLAIGLGGNLLLNPIFANVVNGVPHGWAKGAANGTVTFAVNTDKNYGLRSMGLPNENCMLIKRTDIGTTNYAELIQVVPVNRGMWYMASVYMGNHRSVKTELIIQYLDANGTAISATHKTGGNGFSGLETAERVFIKFQAPANCEKVKFYLRQTGIARNNTNAIMFVARPMLEECTQYTTAPSAWVNSGVTSIHGGSIVANTITAKEIQAGTITAEQLASGSVTTQKIATGSINASHIISKAISADKLNVNSLSAISANLGAVKAGTIESVTMTGNKISGGTITGTTINGTTISGTTINGGTIKGARLEGATGKFTGELEVTQLVGGNIYEVFSYSNPMNVSGKTIIISPSKADRLIIIDDKSFDYITNKTIGHGDDAYDIKVTRNALEVRKTNMTRIVKNYYFLPKNITGNLNFVFGPQQTGGTLVITAVASGNVKTIRTA